MFKIRGKIKFDPVDVSNKHKRQADWKRVVIVQFYDDLSDYYSWMIEKRFNLKLNKPLRGSHFTIINDRATDILNYEEAKKIFDGKEIEITYNPEDIRANEKGHWWVKAYSDDAVNIRSVMGLGYPYFGYHITIGRAMYRELEHSEYIRRQCLKFEI